MNDAEKLRDLAVRLHNSACCDLMDSGELNRIADAIEEEQAIIAKLVEPCKKLVEGHRLYFCLQEQRWLCPFCDSRSVTPLVFRHADNCPITEAKAAIAEAKEKP